MSFSQLYFAFLLVSLQFSYTVVAQDQNVQFNQVVNLNGDMQLNRLIFPDNSKIETFSQTQRQVLVNQNPSPLTANHVVGSSGQPFVQLSQNSMTIATNGATDLVGAQIEFPIAQATLDQNGVTADNTFVAMLAPDRQSWIVIEGVKTVNTTDQTVRLIKMTSIDGEYMAIGRKTVETGSVLSPFGSQLSVNITGSGIQEVEFTDGLRMSIRASQPMTVSADVVNGVSSSMTNGIMPVNNYRYLVRSNLAGVIPNLNNMMTVMQLPLNAARVIQLATSMGAGPNSTISLGIAQRAVLQNPGGGQTALSPPQPQKRQKASTSSSKVAKGTAPAKSSKASATASSAVEPASAETTVTPEPSLIGSATSEATASGEAESAAPSGSSSASVAATTPQPASGKQPPSNTNGQNPAATQLLLSPTFTTITARTVLDTTNGRIAAPVSQLDGEFILTMGMKAASTSTTQEMNQTQGGLMITMAELKLMAQRQRNGGTMPVTAMMDEFIAQSQLTRMRQRRRGAGMI